ncbi:MAG: universal stress protein [Acidimicrobiales bacterium]|jgi:nucleotide-binding universal stress UspA family protein|nr:universal stress protein [Actinomycetota bacterium]
MSSEPDGTLASLPPRAIVVGTDGSATATEAVSRAAALARACDARLVVVCAYERDADSLRPGAPLGSLEAVVRATAPQPAGEQPVPEEMSWRTTSAGAAEGIAAAAAGAARNSGVSDVEWRALPGDPAEVLLAEAQSLPADLLVVGSKGMRSWSGRLLGSVPATVSRHAPCDLLIVRTDR